LKQFILTAHIIKYCPIDRIRERSQNLTKYVVNCANCNKVLFNQGMKKQKKKKKKKRRRRRRRREE
jgi:hypothetical protein